MIDLAVGSFRMGTDDGTFPEDGEGPIRDITLDEFRVGRFAVTNEEFGAFVGATGYVTDAERIGWSFVFHLLLPDEFPPTRSVSGAPWWRQVHGADWCHPVHPGSGLEGCSDHPVVHVSWQDAVAFCSWASVRLPTEAEWECAARGGLDQARYPWGDELEPDGQPRCNIFRGTFPAHSTDPPDATGSVPVSRYGANGFGLHNTVGNAWEWCADWFSAGFHVDGPRDNPIGPPEGDARVIKGGSYLCHDSYCNRYRVGARDKNAIDASTGNLGFRVVADGS